MLNLFIYLLHLILIYYYIYYSPFIELSYLKSRKKIVNIYKGSGITLISILAVSDSNLENVISFSKLFALLWLVCIVHQIRSTIEQSHSSQFCCLCGVVSLCVCGREKSPELSMCVYRMVEIYKIESHSINFDEKYCS